jgi:hypothetical protein
MKLENRLGGDPSPFPSPHWGEGGVRGNPLDKTLEVVPASLINAIVKEPEWN